MHEAGINVKPRFQHNCEDCIFLGAVSLRGDHQGYYDLYYCNNGPFGPTLLARYGDEGHEYASGLSFGKERINPALAAAYDLAVSKDLIKFRRILKNLREIEKETTMNAESYVVSMIDGTVPVPPDFKEFVQSYRNYDRDRKDAVSFPRHVDQLHDEIFDLMVAEVEGWNK